MLTAADQRLLILPVLAGLAAMVVVAIAVAAWQHHRQRSTVAVTFAPRAVAEPRSHVVPITPSRAYDWSADDQQPLR